MSKNISWLEKFAESRVDTITKTASLNKKAAQVIVDCDDCPDAKVGSEITYKNEKYKVVQTDFQDEMGPGVVLEKVADGEGEEIEAPMEATAGFEDLKKDEETDVDADPAATEEVKEEELPVADEDLKEEELPADPTAPVADATAPAAAPVVPGAAPAASGADTQPAATGNPGTAPVSPAAQPVSMAPVGGPKVAPSAPIVGPGQKKLTDAPEHPMVDPGDVYHIEVRDTTEVQDFQAAAAETEQAIAAEDAVDRTNVPGHYTWNQNRILDRMVTDLTGAEPPVADAAQATPAAAPTDAAPETEEVKEEAPVTEEVPATEEPATEEDKKDKIAANRILKKIINGK